VPTSKLSQRSSQPLGTTRERPWLDRMTGDAEHFLAESWRQNVHLHQAFLDGGTLLGVDDLDALITEYGMRTPMVWLMGVGDPREPSQLRSTTDGTPMVEGLVKPEDVTAALAGGRTVSLRGLNHFWPPVGRACRGLEMDLMHPVQSNAYLTPPNTGGLALHHDAHDVFVIQTYGEKVWEVYRSRQPNPVAPWNPATDEPGELVGEYHLRPGDCLYIPLGFPHRAHTVDRPSLHVTLGVDVRRWLDVFDTLRTFAASMPAFREPLPPDFPLDPQRFRERLVSRLQLLLLWASDERLTDLLIDALWSDRRPPLAGSVADALAVLDLTEDTVVRWRDDHVCDVIRDGDDLTLRLWNGPLTLPARYADAVEALRAAAEMPVLAVDARLPAEDRLDLVRRLVTAGVVRVAASDRTLEWLQGSQSPGFQ